MKNIIKGALATTALIMSASFSANALAIDLPDKERQISIFANYCVSGENAYNVGTTLISEDWISGKDSDLIQEEEYRNLFEQYVKYINYGDTTLYTKEFNYGAAMIFTDQKLSLCGVIPFYDMSRDKFVKLMGKNNVNLFEIEGKSSSSGEKYSYIYDNHLVHYTSIKTDEGLLVNVSSASLNEKIAEGIREKHVIK